MRPATNKVVANTPVVLSVGIFVGLLVFALVWFGQSPYTVLAGDDMAWYRRIVDPAGFAKFVFGVYPYREAKTRFLSFGLLYGLKGFDGSYRSYYYFNIAFLVVTSYCIFSLLRTVSKQNALALLASMLFISSRFSYYLVYQVFGAMEMLALCLCTLMFWALVQYLRQNEGRLAERYLILAILLYACQLETHERYMVNLVPIILALWLRNEDRRRRIIGAASSAAVLGAHLLFAAYWTGGNVLHTGAQNATDTLDLFPRMFTIGLINLLGLDMAPEWMGGVNFANYDPYFALAALISTMALGYVVFKFLCRSTGSVYPVRVGNQMALLLLTGMLVNVAPFAITPRQEQRFLAMSFVLLLACLLLCISRVRGVAGLPTSGAPMPSGLPGARLLGALKGIVRAEEKAAVLFLLCSFACNLYFFQNKSKIYFFTAQNTAQLSFAIMQSNDDFRYVRRVYVVGIRDADWALGYGYLFSYYSSNKHIRTFFVDDINEVPRRLRDLRSVAVIGYGQHHSIVRLGRSE